MGQTKLRVIPGGAVRLSTHYDPSESWSREPRLPSVVELRERRRHKQSESFLVYVLVFALGWLARWAALG